MEVSHLWNTRHTTYIRDYPTEIKILRSRHPLEGKTLVVLKWIHRGGKLHALAILPDGSKSFIPAAWTTLDVAQSEEMGLSSLRTIAVFAPSDLLRTRIVVDALLRRFPCLDHEARDSAKKEIESHATQAEAAGNCAGSASTDLGPARSGRAKDGRSGTGKSNGQKGGGTGKQKRRRQS